MIVPMKKAVLIVQAKDADAAMQKLRSLGVVHIQHSQAPKGEDITRIREDIALTNAVIEVLSEKEFLKGSSGGKTTELCDWKFTARHIIDLRKRLDQLYDYSALLLERISQWEAWGDFDPVKIEELAGKNIHIRFYRIAVKEAKNLHLEALVEIISVKNGIANCVIISKGIANIPFKEITTPKMSLSSMRQRLEEDKLVSETIKQEIINNTCYRMDFIDIKKGLTNELEFYEALKGMGRAGEIAYLTGFIPHEQAGFLLKTAKDEKLGLVITEPSEADEVPTLIRNPKWVSLIDPVFKLLEVVPGYRELDVSPLFLLFLALFFGMIIGDAGYGAVYFTLTFFAQRKSGSKDKTVFFLFYLFSFCAIIWGLLTGTVFGQQWYLAAGFKALLPALNETKVVMAFCFLLGALQLSLAHGWGALTKLPSLTALSDIGFICLLWVGFLLAKMFILGDPFPVIGQWLAWAGVVLIILFVSPHKNFLKTIGAGLGTLALGLMGNFGDVVSYIRLFAVGLAGVAVADSVNMLAAGAGGNIVARGLILFIGHGINIMLGPMSVLVHGIRLNVLEFSLLHGNVTWSGIAYKPLKE